MLPRDTPGCGSERSIHNRTLRSKQRRFRRNTTRLSISLIAQLRRDAEQDPE